jgi:hypothetical protein
MGIVSSNLTKTCQQSPRNNDLLTYFSLARRYVLFIILWKTFIISTDIIAYTAQLITHLNAFRSISTDESSVYNRLRK